MSLQLIVADLSHSIDFYEKKLNFDIDFRYEYFYAGIIKNGYSVHLKKGQPTMEERKNRRKNEDVNLWK